MKQVFCIGELLIDFVCRDPNVSLMNGIRFEKKAGGAPANVAAAITKLGGKAAFMGQVGNDPFGEFLEKTLQDADVDTSMLIKEKQTTLAFVSLDSHGERDFTFMRGADSEYKFEQIDLSKIKRNDIIHFGSATALLPGQLKDTYIKLLQYAKAKQLFISFDPNYRASLITDLQKFRKDCITFIANAHFIKVSAEEASLLTGETNMYKAAEALLSYGAKTIAITLGERGTLLTTNENQTIIPSITVQQVDTTGAGDAFVGAMLYQFAKEERVHMDFTTLQQYISFANKVGALTCTNYGAISSLPTLEDIK
ncbi:carbohydrate kinase [Bacillus sp. AFS018417]|uniref:carbohydrate kinase family protein n=1 Tax=Bacillus sp. AFS018417 TaxID=2033491 RepID=UPI000BF9F960|nr:carbohydrate kinase [Bacillus sp. AFS018417]PEZ07535.1 carbohydrate kinase [Bacillus sp. AFS018417]